ncbi:MAG TPA: energy transducer TonB [Candidatus Sulfotelmatobacter sp.]|nr:energy transducer TonB [Candidatus Sulfotelmatobacter sp.]
MKAVVGVLARFILPLGTVALLLSGLTAQVAPSVPASTAPKFPPCRGPHSFEYPDHMVRPKYPKEKLKAGTAGTVDLTARIGSDGKTKDLKLVSGEPVFATPAIEAVRKWRFHPALDKNEAVETTYKVRIRFVLLLQEAIPDVELESPQEPVATAGTHVPTDTPEGRLYLLSEQSGAIAPKAIYSPEPEFSEEARKTKEQGLVTLSLTVGTDGKPRNVKVFCSCAPDLNDQAINAVQNWRFEPGTKDGKPVMVEIGVEVQFHLN